MPALIATKADAMSVALDLREREIRALAGEVGGHVERLSQSDWQGNQ